VSKHWRQLIVPCKKYLLLTIRFCICAVVAWALYKCLIVVHVTHAVAVCECTAVKLIMCYQRTDSAHFKLCVQLCTALRPTFSALTLLAGRQEQHPACQNWVVRYWRGYLSRARCNWFAYGPADATATASSIAPVKSRMVDLSGAGLPRLSWKKAVKRM